MLLLLLDCYYCRLSLLAEFRKWIGSFYLYLYIAYVFTASFVFIVAFRNIRSYAYFTFQMLWRM